MCEFVCDRLGGVCAQVNESACECVCEWVFDSACGCGCEYVCVSKLAGVCMCVSGWVSVGLS